MTEMFEFCKSVKLGRFKKKKKCERLCVTLTSSAFFWKITVGQYFKSLANKINTHKSTFLHFFQYDPKEVRVLTNLIFLALG